MIKTPFEIAVYKNVVYLHLCGVCRVEMAPMIHLYEQLTKELGTEYWLGKNKQFSVEVDTSDVNSKVAARIKDIAFHYSQHGPARGLEEMLNDSPVVILTQISNEYGWFSVSQQN